MEQNLQKILELSLDIHYYYKYSESSFSYVSPALLEHFGIEPAALVGNNYHFFLENVHPEDRDLFESHWNYITQHPDSTSASCDYRCRTKSGKFLWYNDTHRYVYDNNGSVEAIIGCLRDITDLKVVEILKSTSKERTSLAMEAASDSIWEWKVTSNKLFFDARFYSILGYEPYEFPDNFVEWEQRIHPDDRKNTFLLLKQCSTGAIDQIHVEYRIRTKSNHWKWLLCRAKVSAKNDEGRITKIIGTQTDITKLKEAEEEIRKHNIALQNAEKTIQKNSAALQSLYNDLKENEERLQLFFDEAKNSAFMMLEMVNKNLVITEFSLGGENIFGLKKKEIFQKNIDEVFKNSRNKHFCDLLLHLNNTNTEYKGEIAITNANGQLIGCILTVHFIVNPEIGIKKVLIILTDIQERKEFEITLRLKNEELTAAEEELKATNDELKFVNEELQKRNIELRTINEKLFDSEEKFRELADNTNDAFWLRDDKELLYINSSFEKLWGKSKKEIFENPRYLEKWVYPEDRNRFTKWDDFNLFSTIPYYSEQFRIIKPNGSVRWIWSRIHPVLDKEGKIYRIAGIQSDITDLKEIEEALLRAKEKAMESDNLKSAFLANISHEIRTPMNGILGFVELLNDESLDRETRDQYINIISKSSNQLLQIIDDIMDISKIEANQLKVSVKECNINSVARDIFVYYQKDKHLSDKQGLALKIDLPLDDKFASLFTDESRLRQILMNILDNAVKFTSKGEIAFGYRLTENKTIQFYIKDTGVGIPRDQQHLVFERFRQVDNSNTRRHGGTGLGLSISQGLAKLLGGTITFDSEVGKGTTFYVNLSYNPKNRKIFDHENPPQELSPNWENKIILVVEDDPINYELIRTMLEPSNAKIIHAESGEDALRLFSKVTSINIILMDIRLPGINGYQAMRSIKDINPAVPVIAQTAFAMSEDNQSCLEQGFDDYIAKPINRKLLFKIIQKQFTN